MTKTNNMNWNWIVLTEDPRTLPPVNEPVFVSDGKDIGIGQYSLLRNGEHCWTGAYQAPFLEENTEWYCDGSEDIIFVVRAWHAFPTLDTVSYLL